MGTRRNSKRRSTTGRFAMMPLRVLESPAVISLSHGEFRVLVAYASVYNGKNNGSLGLTRTQAQEGSGISKNLLMRAQQTLVERGLLVLAKPGSRTPPRPNLYALTWHAVDEGRHDLAETPVPTHAYRAWISDSPCPMKGQPMSHEGTRERTKGPPIAAHRVPSRDMVSTF